MSQSSVTRGIALRCNLHGEILEVPQNDLGCGEVFQPGKNFVRMIHPGSLPKALNFLAEIQSKGAALDWDLFMRFGDNLECIHFSGVILGNDLLLIGAKNSLSLVHLFNKLAPGGKKLLKRIKPKISEVPNEKPSKKLGPLDDSLYDQFAVLYNEMANLQRELSKQNIEHKKLSKQKDRFVGMAAHELRHPLGIINMLTGFLLEEAVSSLSPKQIEYLTLIKTYCESMQKLVDDFLDISIIESGKLHLNKTPVNIVKTFQENLALHRQIAEKKQVDLKLSHDEKIPQIMVDRLKIEQVMNNLLANALKYSPEGSRVEIHLHHSGDEIIFEVKDQGPGIHPKLMPHLFEPFEKAEYPQDESRQSTGLGLTIARKIVEAHKGKIQVKFEADRGSTFIVTLPIQTNSV
jgi:signal transduction histidine kinase